MERIKFPENRQMHKAGGKSKAFCVQSQKQYDDLLAEGWVFNPADLKNKPAESKEVDKQEELAETEPEIRVHRPEVLGQITEEGRGPLQCGLCDFKGKNSVSLRMHKFHKHKDK